MTKQQRVMMGVKPDTKKRVDQIKGDGYTYDRFFNDLLDKLEQNVFRSPPASNETGEVTYPHVEEVIN
jgi:hypothetical protein